MIPDPPHEPASDEERPSSSPASKDEPSATLFVVWYLWIVMTALSCRFTDNDLIKSLYIGNLVLSPAWMMLALRPAVRYFLPVVLTYLVMLLVPEIGDPSQNLLILLGVAAAWGILRVCRVVTLDYLRSADANNSTPRLAAKMQYSMLSLSLYCAVFASGVTLWLYFRESSEWLLFQLIFFSMVPSELLLVGAMLGRWPLFVRLTAIFLAIQCWFFFEVIINGFQGFEKMYRSENLVLLCGIPLGQLVPLGMLRYSGYRVGMPKLRERQKPELESVEPQSPWDD